MHSFHEFLTMGGYAEYVWPAYAVTFLVLVGIGWGARRSYRRARMLAARTAEEMQR